MKLFKPKNIYPTVTYTLYPATIVYINPNKTSCVIEVQPFKVRVPLKIVFGNIDDNFNVCVKVSTFDDAIVYSVETGDIDPRFGRKSYTWSTEKTRKT